MLRFLYFCIGILLVFTGLAEAQKGIEFNHLTVENGLSQSTVYSIAQDYKGFIWLATRDGLDRYDSRSIKVYKNSPGDSSSLSWDATTSLLSDSRNHLWIGTSKGLNIYNPHTDGFKRILHYDKDSHSLSNNLIFQVYEDTKQRIWVGTNNGLNLLRSAKDAKFDRFFYSTNTASAANIIHAIKEDQHGVLWVGTENGLYSMTLINGRYVTKRYQNSGNNKNNFIRALDEDSKGNIWVGTEGGLQFVNPSRTALTAAASIVNFPSITNSIRKIKTDNAGKIWIGTFNGLFIYDPKQQRHDFYENDPGNPKSLGQNSLYDIFEDRDGSMWIGTFYGGANIIYNHSISFQVFTKGNQSSSLGSNIISAITEDRYGNVLIGTQESGLNVLERKTGLVLKYKSNEGDRHSLSSDVIKVIYRDTRGDIWFGSHDLQLYDQKTRKFETFKSDASGGPYYINAICEDDDGKYWIASREPGIYLFDRKTRQFRSAHDLTNNQFRDKAVKFICKDSDLNVWFGTDAGLYRKKAGTHNVIAVPMHQPQDSILTPDNVNVIIQDSKKIIWVGTVNGGLYRYNLRTATFKNYTTADGLPSNNILGLIEDNNGFLWLSTDRGISRFDSQKPDFRNYNRQDGLPGDVFNQNAFYKDGEGNLYFGCYNGLVKFNPLKIAVNYRWSPVVFTGYTIYDGTEHIGVKKLIPEQLSNTNPDLSFNYRQNTIQIYFAILNYIKPGKNKYAYKLEGVEHNWNYVNNPYANYSNLAPGHYTLLVRGANNDGTWNPEPIRMTINIAPPPWRTWWAYLIYCFIIVGILLLIIRYIVIRDRLTREEDLHQMKLDFFTNISHELRTPLTLILGPLESLIKDEEIGLNIRTKLSQAKFNADRLLRLVSELLDFRRTETGHLNLQVGKHDLVSFSKGVFLSFEDYASKKGISYDFNADEASISLYFDDIQLEKVLYNLLSNAFKFVSSSGSVNVRIEKTADGACIHIADTGTGIPIISQPNIFDNYYQVKTYGQQSLGTGIGLALSKSIVELHHGSISFTSKPESDTSAGYTCFSVFLRSGNTHFSDTELMDDQLPTRQFSRKPPEPVAINDQNFDDQDKYEILLVEDSEEIRHFICENLQADYHVLQAENGKEGLEIAFDKIPDVIISDVMMPVMDGTEFSKIIKADERTSHIPLIMLTALTDHIHQITGLQTGVDIYLNKPFSIEVLALSIGNLLKAREAMRKKFSQELTLQPSNITIDAHEEQFLNRLIKITEDNLMNPAFGVDMLCAESGMSRNVLYRKLDALAAMSVNDFIKSIRLKRSLQLLQTQQYTVYEVAAMVGFEDSKYFSKEFKRRFGKAPSTYKELKSAPVHSK